MHNSSWLSSYDGICLEKKIGDDWMANLLCLKKHFDIPPRFRRLRFVLSSAAHPEALLIHRGRYDPMFLVTKHHDSELDGPVKMTDDMCSWLNQHEVLSTYIRVEYEI